MRVAHGVLFVLVMLLLGFGSASIKTSNIKPNSNRSMVRVLDPLYFTPAANSTSHRKLYSVTLERCIEACKTRTWCTAINYQREWTRCDLIKHGSSGAGSVGETMTIKRNKADWDMVGYEYCSSCSDIEICNITGNIPTCQIEGCYSPSTISNANILGNLHTVDSKICYECSENYNFLNLNVSCSTCTSVGSWTPVSLRCCTQPPGIPNAYTKNTTTGGYDVCYECLAGFENVGGDESCSSCTINGTWTDTTIKCCSQPAEISNARKLDITTPGYDVCYACLSGFVNIGGDELCSTCTVNGNWTHPTIQCCTQPPEFSNARNMDSASFGYDICYECLSGYQNIGGDQLCSTCMTDGNWTDVTIQCEVVQLCDNNWLEYNGHCYLEDSTAKNWANAKSACASNNAYLLSLETETEAIFVSTTFANWRWIGGYDGNSASIWYWESGPKLNYTNWETGEPSDTFSTPNCMLVGDNWRWHDWGCSSTFGYICEKEP